MWITQNAARTTKPDVRILWVEGALALFWSSFDQVHGCTQSKQPACIHHSVVHSVQVMCSGAGEETFALPMLVVDTSLGCEV